ncbi:hypothetical protein BGW36DRAFT_202279 [Talaromyces proteolyticus]|uniref:Uncharacterized protein n=1 Tax=Talaromyces proteolyticus TaxID=1131652 RepID=A0AAD4KT98_9EURO|nr:uncharacterized protein BGW36DRAFT_202279 [Talaromyces proteolyticus]KAH8695450.1 hypothetical protein BGW36DRAFT_202279 [Talaromyces proteolyticus]
MSDDTVSPFQLPPEAAAELKRSDAFQNVRSHMKLKEQSSMLSFCPFHIDECSEQELSTFRFHRDIIYALLLPLFEVHDQATQIATRVLARRKGIEPERAFRGEARDAFSWLHCILTEEQDFCLAQGCPACIVFHVLSSEPTIRLVTVACMLCDLLPNTELSEAKRSLPDFAFWLKAMEKAVCDDTLWGESFWPEIEHRAKCLSGQIKHLIMQCVEFRSATELQKTSIKPSCAVTTRPEKRAYRVHVQSIPVQSSALARRQLHMVWEEQELASKFLISCWASMCWNDRRRKIDFSRASKDVMS